MDFKWSELLQKGVPWATDYVDVAVVDVAQVAAGVIGLIGSAVSLVMTLVGSVPGVSRHPQEQPSGPPLRFSLKSILVGWISTLVWMMVAQIVFFVGSGIYLAHEAKRQPPPLIEAKTPAHQQRFGNHNEKWRQSGEKGRHPPVTEKLSSLETQPQQNPKRKGQTQPGFWEESNQQLREHLEKEPRLQVLLLVLMGLVYARGAYVAASCSKTTVMMRLTHGLIAVGSLEITAGYLIHRYCPELLSFDPPTILAYWSPVCLIVGCVVGSILGSED